MDTTGVVLGAVGLLAIADKFDALYTLFSTFRQYRNEVGTFTTFLKVKRTTFRTECRLLSSQLERNSESQQPGLYQGQIMTLADLLGPSYDSCESILTEIEQSLEKISREAEGFANLPIEGAANETAYRKRIGLAFGKARRNADNEEFSSWIQELRLMRGQIHEQTDDFQQGPAVALMSKLVLQHLELIQNASKWLYDILATRWCCDIHVKHDVSLNLILEEAALRTDSKVNFELRFACRPTNGDCNSSPLWLKVESSPNAWEPSLEGRPPHPQEATALWALQKRVGGHATLPRSARRVAFDLSPAAGCPISEPRKNLDDTEKLCEYIRHTLSEEPEDSCFGLIGESLAFRHLLYRTDTASFSQGNGMSLKQLLQEQKDYNMLEKLKLARILAISVLSFHSTIWLPRFWRSDDIWLYEPCTSNIIPPPHLRSNLAPGGRTDQSVVSSERCLAPNPELFSLAVVLMELGYNESFDDISHVSQTLSDEQYEKETFFAAKRLASGLDQKVGNHIYIKLVKLCLGCHFTGETSWERQELRSAVLKEVVNQLDVCINSYKSIAAETLSFRPL